MRKWSLEGTISFKINDYETTSETALEALDDLIEDGLFDLASYTVKISKANYEEVENSNQ